MGTAPKTANRSPVHYDRALILADAADRGWDRKQLALEVRRLDQARGVRPPAVSTIYRFVDDASPIQTPRIALLIANALGHKFATRYRVDDRRRDARRTTDRRTAERRKDAA